LKNEPELIVCKDAQKILRPAMDGHKHSKLQQHRNEILFGQKKGCRSRVDCSFLE
jgi:hypothetical protein